MLLHPHSIPTPGWSPAQHLYGHETASVCPWAGSRGAAEGLKHLARPRQASAEPLRRCSPLGLLTVGRPAPLPQTAALSASLPSPAAARLETAALLQAAVSSPGSKVGLSLHMGAVSPGDRPRLKPLDARVCKQSPHAAGPMRFCYSQIRGLFGMASCLLHTQLQNVMRPPSQRLGRRACCRIGCYLSSSVVPVQSPAGRCLAHIWQTKRMNWLRQGKAGHRLRLRVHLELWKDGPGRAGLVQPDS
mmetsp:Transcript_68466/g.164408  ORF Transcript_68466/g.164408 Transcript_68466/m.164408 type:complete len:246 (-) Transcript_68466:558-1295(-)